MNRFLNILFTTLFFSFAGCAARPQSLPQVSIFRGYYTKSSEVSTFSPCGIRQLLWLTGRVEPLLRAVTSPNGLVGGTIYTEFTGELSPPGRYGHLGAYRRQLAVHNISIARPTRPEDCNSDRR